MELRALRSFLAVAEELHFGRAAERVGVSQPSLSQHIARLEAELGTALFQRTSRRVRLTPAGAALVPGARRALIEVQRGARAARDAAGGSTGELVIGALGSALNGMLPALVRVFTAQAPDVAIDIRQLDTAEQLAALQDRRLDVGFIRSAEPTPGLVVTSVAEEPLVAVLPADHPLAAGATVALEALADQPFVLWPRQASVGFYDEVITACRHAGFSPHIKFEGRGAETLLGLVAAGLGVSIQPEPYRNLARTGVAFRPLAAPAPTTTLQVAHRRGDLAPVVRRFLAIVDALVTGDPDHR
ncbi:MAG: LysR family transcriptional regulator [Solirubrobacterales bacterium]|nr:LysR family transcriptional regulator [Solirubrobacterales bacterium]